MFNKNFVFKSNNNIDIYKALLPLYVFSQLLGMCPCWPVKSHVSAKFLKVLNFSYQVFIILSIAYCFYIIGAFEKPVSNEFSQKIITMISFWLIPFGIICYIISTIGREHHARLILQKISQMDAKFLKFGIHNDHQILFYLSWISLPIIIAGTLYTFFMYRYKFKVLDVFLRSISVSFRLTAEAQFILLMSVCYKNYRNINKLLRRMDLVKTSIFEKDFTRISRRSENIDEDLKALARIHHDIFRIIKIINAYYSFDIMMIFILNFTLLIALLYNMILIKGFHIPSIATVGSLIRLSMETFSMVGIVYCTQKEVFIIIFLLIFKNHEYHFIL